MKIFLIAVLALFIGIQGYAQDSDGGDSGDNAGDSSSDTGSGGQSAADAADAAASAAVDAAAASFDSYSDAVANAQAAEVGFAIGGISAEDVTESYAELGVAALDLAVSLTNAAQAAQQAGFSALAVDIASRGYRSDPTDPNATINISYSLDMLGDEAAADSSGSSERIVRATNRIIAKAPITYRSAQIAKNYRLNRLAASYKKSSHLKMQAR